MLPSRRIAALVTLGLLLAACGDDRAEPREGDGAAGPGPTIVATTGILADVVGALTGEAADVSSVVPVGADPHGFQASAQDVARMEKADVLVVNGGGLEAALVDVIESAADDGVPVCTALDSVTPLPSVGGGGDDPAPTPSDDGADPHFFTDPRRMAEAASGLLACIGDAVPGFVDDAARAVADGYLDDLRALDAELEASLAAIPPDRRVLVTNHDAFAYFADRYGFEIVGTVIPGVTTADAPSARDLTSLARAIEETRVPVIFVETTSPTDAADAVAAEVGDVEVVPLYSGSLGEDGSGAQTYIGYLRTNAQAIAEALG